MDMCFMVDALQDVYLGVMQDHLLLCQWFALGLTVYALMGWLITLISYEFQMLYMWLSVCYLCMTDGMLQWFVLCHGSVDMFGCYWCHDWIVHLFARMAWWWIVILHWLDDFQDGCFMFQMYGWLVFYACQMTLSAVFWCFDELILWHGTICRCCDGQ